MAGRKLFTKEDPNRLHKTLGFLSVASFLYRYGYVFPKFGSLGMDNDVFSWITMLLHLLLSTSSLIFHVLPRRIVNKPMIIWEEYRLHAIVFTIRCFSVWCFHWFKPQSVRNTETEYFLLYCMVMIHHVVVDKITLVYGTPGQTAVRVQDDRKKDGGAIFYAKRFYGFYQFAALGSHLLPYNNLGAMGFNALIAIQSSAFLMTLFRKGLIEWYSHAFWYTTCLVLSQIHMYHFFGAMFFVKVFTMFMLRTKLRMSKYLVWMIFVLIHTPWGESLLSQTRGLSPPLGNIFAYTSPSLSISLDFPIFDFTLTTRSLLLFGMVFMGYTVKDTKGTSALSKLAETETGQWAYSIKNRYVGENVRERLRAQAAAVVPEQVQASWDSVSTSVASSVSAVSYSVSEKVHSAGHAAGLAWTATNQGPAKSQRDNKVHAH
jgi:hypothetical protein